MSKPIIKKPVNKNEGLGMKLNPDIFDKIDLDLDWWLLQTIFTEANINNEWEYEEEWEVEYKSTIDRLLASDILLVTDTPRRYKLNPIYIKMEYSKNLW